MEYYIYRKQKTIKFMRLFKTTKDNEVLYFSTVAKTAKHLNTSSSHVKTSIALNNRCKGWIVEETDDIVLTSEVDKYTDEKQ